MRTLLLFSLALVACSGGGGGDAVPGVRLGMTPRDVRDRFDPTKEGTWQMKVAAGPGANDDTILAWTTTAPTAKATSASFEFHLGMLVAVRAHLRESAGAEHIESTPKTVTVRSPAPAGEGGTDVTLLSRDCPTHHDEAESLATRSHRSGG